MATVKVKFRASTVPGKVGTVYYLLTHKQNHKQICTQIHVHSQCWDEKRGRLLIPPEGNARLEIYQCCIEYELSLFRCIIQDFHERRVDFTITNLIEAYTARLHQKNVLSFMQEQIRKLEDHGKFSTARNYRRALKSFSGFLENRDIPFYLLNERLVLLYNNWLLQKNIVRNSLSFYMRILRSVYNKAVGQGLVQNTNPFLQVYTGVDQTRKRAVSEDLIVRLQHLDLSHSRSLALARDLFLFSYCTRGMAFVDIAYLKKGNIQGGMISYVRHKTGQRLTIQMEPCIEKIIASYRDMTKDSSYVFPILSSENSLKAFQQYQTALGYQNLKLKKISKLLGENFSLTSYTARHSWATAARNHNVPLSVISAGMGHTSEKTTQIYLDSLENSIVDQANHVLLEQLNGHVSM